MLGEGVGVCEQINLTKSEFARVGQEEMKFREASVFMIIAFEYDWCTEFYKIIWDMIVERRNDMSKQGFIWLSRKCYTFRELEKLKKNIRSWDMRRSDYLFSVVVWRSCNILEC
jgi:hypothetical protein